MKIPIGTYHDMIAGARHLEIDSFQNTFVDGASGTGKSTLVEDVIIQDIRAEQPIIFIDPHGPSISRILKYIPEHLSRKVIYINPLAKKVPGFNFFHATTPEERQKRGVIFLSIIKSWAEKNYGPETEHIIETATTAIEQLDDPTVIDIYLFIVREMYRSALIDKTENQLLKDFQRQFDEELRTSERMSKLSPSVNKVAPFIRPVARTIFGQSDSLDLIKLIDDGYIILIDLDKGKIGEVTAALIGAAILSFIQAKMFERKAEGRKKCTIYVDEFQTFGHGVHWTTFFAEGRKYDIRLWLITQSITQIPQEWISPVLNGCNNIFCLAVGAEDAERMAKEFGDKTLERQLIFQSDRSMFAKIKLDLDRHLYQNVSIYPPLDKTGDESNWRNVLKNSRMRWGKNRKDLDAAIEKRLKNAA